MTLTSELAGLGLGGLVPFGDVSHVRAEAHAQQHWALSQPYLGSSTGAALSLVGDVGLLYPLQWGGLGAAGGGLLPPHPMLLGGASSPRSHITDRFFLGGAQVCAFETYPQQRAHTAWLTVTLLSHR